jgi:hypothetical protein
MGARMHGGPTLPFHCAPRAQASELVNLKN